MREIKFRAWCMLDNTMIAPTAIEDMIYQKENQFTLRQLYEDFIFMQSTGLFDKNGAEVYEGDILRNVDNPFVDKLPFEVKWNEYYGAWFWWSLFEAGTDHLYQNIAKNCEVIGNIHENPELLEVGGNDSRNSSQY